VRSFVEAVGTGPSALLVGWKSGGGAADVGHPEGGAGRDKRRYPLTRYL
jgi:hypothetical protein